MRASATRLCSTRLSGTRQPRALLLALAWALAACQSGSPEASQPAPSAGAPSAALAEPVAVPAAEPAAAPATQPAAAEAAAESGAAPAAAPAFDPTPWTTPPADLAAPPADAEKRRSGLVTKVLVPGKGGERPRAQDAAIAHYSIWSSDGRLVETTAKRATPRSFRVGKQIAGWEEGLQLMTVGERRRLWIPEKLAFKGRPGKPRGTLVWDAELLEVRRAPDAPADVAKPPKDASRTKSGLAWKEIAPGAGGARPKASSTVMVHYTGWTTDGKAFDSTAFEGTPATFELANVIEGWTEGIQLMTKGQRVRFWIPKELAYKGKKGKPAGTLVFDVELVDFSE